MMLCQMEFVWAVKGKSWTFRAKEKKFNTNSCILSSFLRIAIYPNNLNVALLAHIRNKPEFSRLFTCYILGIFWESFSPPIIEIWIKILLTLKENIQKKPWKDNTNVTPRRSSVANAGGRPFCQELGMGWVHIGQWIFSISALSHELFWRNCVFCVFTL